MREALRVLQDQGLVEVFPHRGAFVMHMTAEKAREIFDLRQLLESYAIASALRNGYVDDETLQTLTDAFCALCTAVDAGNAAAVVEADMEFHRLVSAASHLGVLLGHLRILQSQTRQVIAQTKRYHSDIMSEAETHRPILDAVRARDATLAADAVSKHIWDTRDLLMIKMQLPPGDQAARVIRHPSSIVAEPV
jgi:DNA-binding GntR family transcriptional regulator